MDVAAHPGTHQYIKYTTDVSTLGTIKADIVAAFGTILDNFVPVEALISTVDNFTHPGGNENTPVGQGLNGESWYDFLKISTSDESNIKNLNLMSCCYVKSAS